MTIEREILFARLNAEPESQQAARLVELEAFYQKLLAGGMTDRLTVPGPNNDQNSEQRFLLEAPKFSDAAKEALKGMGMRVVTLHGLSMLGLEAEGAVLRDIYRKREARNEHGELRRDAERQIIYEMLPECFALLRGRIGEVAIDPSNFLMESTDYKTLEEQRALLDQESGGVLKNVPGTRVVMSSVPTFCELDFRLYLTTGERLFGPNFPNSTWLRTDTTKDEGFVVIGKDKGSGPDLSFFWHDSVSREVSEKNHMFFVSWQADLSCQR